MAISSALKVVDSSPTATDFPIFDIGLEMNLWPLFARIKENLQYLV